MEPGKGLARYEALVDRLTQTPEVRAARAQRMKRRGEAFVRRLTRMFGGAFAVALIAFIWGVFVAPIGFSGVMLTVLLMFAVFCLLAVYPKTRDVVVETLPEQPLKALPAQVEDWLDLQRRALPAPAARDVDRIMVQLDGLAPDLKALQPADPRAEEARVLLSDHLPRLVRSYTEVPPRYRDQPETRARLREGLKTVSDELDRLSRDLARDRLNALEVEEKFLESRYRGGQPDKES